MGEWGGVEQREKGQEERVARDGGQRETGKEMEGKEAERGGASMS